MYPQHKGLEQLALTANGDASVGMGGIVLVGEVVSVFVFDCFEDYSLDKMPFSQHTDISFESIKKFAPNIDKKVSYICYPIHQTLVVF